MQESCKIRANLDHDFENVNHEFEDPNHEFREPGLPCWWLRNLGVLVAQFFWRVGGSGFLTGKFTKNWYKASTGIYQKAVKLGHAGETTT